MRMAVIWIIMSVNLRVKVGFVFLLVYVTEIIRHELVYVCLCARATRVCVRLTYICIYIYMWVLHCPCKLTSMFVHHAYIVQSCVCMCVCVCVCANPACVLCNVLPLHCVYWNSCFFLSCILWVSSYLHYNWWSVSRFSTIVRWQSAILVIIEGHETAF